MLYRAEAFEPLTETPWREHRVCEAIAEIVRDTEEAYCPEGLWPADEWDAWTSPTPMKNLYVGAAGVLAGVDILRRRGLAEISLDLGEASRRALEAWRVEPDFPAGIELPLPANASLLCGEAGPLLAAFRLTGDPVLADALHDRVLANVHNEARELMWGSPGTMIAARRMLDWTGDERWREAWRVSAQQLLGARDGDGLWTQRMYGESERGLGPAHGLVGNVLALLAGDLDPPVRASLVSDTVTVLERTAVWEGNQVNWPIAEGRPLSTGSGEIRFQWCMGAPGILVAAAGYLPDELVLAAAEAVWSAGPHGDEKGASICHGTAGNGYALLKTFDRTGDEQWLDRARRFAVHALEQARRLAVVRGRGRHSLFTGDVGTALFAADCLDGIARYPVLDGRGSGAALSAQRASAGSSTMS